MIPRRGAFGLLFTFLGSALVVAFQTSDPGPALTGKPIAISPVGAGSGIAAGAGAGPGGAAAGGASGGGASGVSGTPSGGTPSAAPGGSGAPVIILAASPAPTSSPTQRPAGISTTTRNSRRPASSSAPRTAYPSIAELSNDGTASGETIAVAAARPSASSSGTSSAGSRRTAPITVSMASLMLITRVSSAGAVSSAYAS